MARAIGVVAAWAFFVGPVLIYLAQIPAEWQQDVYNLSCVGVGIVATLVMKGRG